MQAGLEIGDQWELTQNEHTSCCHIGSSVFNYINCLFSVLPVHLSGGCKLKTENNYLRGIPIVGPGMMAARTSYISMASIPNTTKQMKTIRD